MFVRQKFSVDFDERVWHVKLVGLEKVSFKFSNYVKQYKLSATFNIQD